MEATDAHSVYHIPLSLEGRLPEHWAKRGAANNPEAWEIVEQWLLGYTTDFLRQRRRPPGLVLLGPPGTGKTYLASTILNLTRNLGGTTAFVMDPDISSVMWGDREGREDAVELLELLTRVTCFVWDDILRFGADASRTESFLRRRYNNGRTTIITINDEVPMPDVFRSFLDPFTWAAFSGRDMRSPDAGR